MFQVIEMPAKTLAWWLDQRDEIDFAPIYQRKSKVWSQKDREFLIDSILNGYDIPKIYMADFTFMSTKLNRAKKKYAIIDGKQRFESIFAFFDGEVVLANDFEYAEDPSLRLGGLAYKDLVSNYPKIGRKFENHNLTVMSVITDDEAQINELFVRLNRSRPLTGAEIRNAMPGKVPALIRDLVKHEFFQNRIKFNTLRSQDKNLAAKLLLIEHRGHFVDTKKSHLDGLVRDDLLDPEEEAVEPGVTDEAEREAIDEAAEEIEETVTDSEGRDVERSAERVRGVLDRMAKVFVPRDPLLASQTPIVLYYWLIRNVEDEQLGKVRKFVAAFEESVRANRKRDAGDPEKDSLLDDYYTMSRTANDAGSMRGRYRILEARFKAV
jgi:hypothetical protein